MEKKSDVIIRSILALFEVGIVILSQNIYAQLNDVKILQSDEKGIVVEYKPIHHTPMKINSDGVEFMKYDFDGSTMADYIEAGDPQVKFRSIVIRFLGEKNNTVEVLNTDYEEIQNILLYPAPHFQKGDVIPVSRYTMNANSYAISGFLPERIVSLANIGETRGIYLGALQINPIQYDAARRTLRKYARIVVRVNFGPHGNIVKHTEIVKSIAINENVSAYGQPEISNIGKTTTYSSVLSSGIWYKFGVTEDGMYKITGQMLLDAGIPSSTDPHTIKIYGNGGIELPLSPTDPYVDDLLENAIYIYDGGQAGVLDASDYLIFYGKSTRGWRYNSTTKKFNHYINHFVDANIYWLTYGGRQAKLMTSIISATNPSPYRPTTVTGKIFREDDKNNVFSSGIEWLGESFNNGSQIVYRHQLFGIDFSQPVKYRFYFGVQSSPPYQFTIYEHDAILNPSINNSVVGDLYFISSEVSALPNFSDEESRLRFKFATSSAGGIGYIDWYEIFYEHFLKAQNDLFNFHTADTTNIAEYKINGFSGGQVFVFNVSKFDSVVLISNSTIQADTCTFQIEQNAGGVKELYVVGQNGFKAPGTFSLVNNQDLHGDPTEAEYIIITHPDFIQAAQRLKTYRGQLAENPLKTLVVDVNKIYNEFGGGLFTPIAVRNYLRYVYLNWSKSPKYVLLFGDGDFDYKRILSEANPNWIPPWESTESFSEIQSYASDDPFAIFFPGERVNLGVGRLTARSLQEANTMVDKIIEYETHPVRDPWELRFTFVADDGPAAPGVNDGFRHTWDAENVAIKVPKLFDKKKIYLYEYPTVYTPGGRRKPAVNLAIQNAINQGTLVINFTGHGNPRVWTHEAVFVRESDFPMLHNKGKYFFLVAATCNYSNFDAVSNQSSGEVLTSMADAGAIGVFSATRAVYADENATLNQTLYRFLCDTTQFGFIRQQRLGDIIYRTKQLQNLTNDRKYFLLGDPALQFSFPKLVSSIDSVNHVSLNQLVQLKALEHTTVSATVRDTATYTPRVYTGNAQVVVYDASKSVTLYDPELNSSMSYNAEGSVIFRGDESVNNGVINSEFIVPKDISYSNATGKIALYFWNDSTDGAGYENIVVNGTDSTAPPDSKGPQIHLYVDRRNFLPGDVVSASPVLIADLSDSSGINTSNSGIGHRLEAWLDNQSESISLSDYYKSKINTYTEGVVEYPLGALPIGTHKIRMRAWDTYNNPSTQETVFDVVTGVGLKLSNVFNYPNPFSHSTVFTFEQNQISSVDAQVKIYTVAGRLIQTIQESNIANQFVRISWDGRDRDGDELANGVYLYKIIAKTHDGRYTSEALGKLCIMK